MDSLWLYIILISLIAIMFLSERRYPGVVLRIEENILATLLATITLVSFFQVIARYGFNASWSGGLEFVRILFAWMILFGMSYGIKTGLHLGVDAVIRLLPKPAFKIAAVMGGLFTLLYAVILISADWLAIFGSESEGGAISYWLRFFNAGIGLQDLRYPLWLQESFGFPERVPRWVAYMMLPFGLALLGFRALEATVQIVMGRRELIIASHEGEDLLADNRANSKD